MFLGAVEIESGVVYESENALKTLFNGNNIVIVEKDFIITDLINNMPIFTNPVFYATTWNGVKEMSSKYIVKALIFDRKTTMEKIYDLLKNRVQYIFNTYNVDSQNLQIELIGTKMIVKTNVVS